MMSTLLPVGMIRFRAALASVAQTRIPEAWATAKPSEREWLAEGTVIDGFWQNLFTRPGKVAAQAYGVIRPLLDRGALVAVKRGHSGAPENVEPAFWTSSNSDRLTALLNSDILIREADLDAVLKGEPAPSYSNFSSVATASDSRSNKGGRPPHRDLEPFWIEVCRLVATEKLPREQAVYTSRLAQWAADRGAFSYDEETIRKKIRKFFDAAEWR